jgi:hypothetical protein
MIGEQQGIQKLFGHQILNKSVPSHPFTLLTNFQALRLQLGAIVDKGQKIRARKGGNGYGLQSLWIGIEKNAGTGKGD